jgi:hypothetical protein
MKKYIVVFDANADGAFEAKDVVDGMVLSANDFDKVTAYNVKIKVRAKLIDENNAFEDLYVNVYVLDEFIDAFNQEDVNTAVDLIALVTVK